MSEVPLKILCLHGYRQTGEIFKKKTGSLRKVLKKQAELVYMTAPLSVPPLEDSDSTDEGRGWWFSREDNYFNAKHKSDYVKGFEECLDTVKLVFEKEGPFDGILGFSQGAAMVALICELQQTLKLPFFFKFAIIIAGFISQSSPHQNLYADKVTLPTLHVYGENDQVIGQEMSEELLKYFNNPVILKHPGGHFVPAAGQQKPIYIKFLEDMQNVCKS